MSVSGDFQPFLGRKVLIIGDVGTGKTRLTSQLLNDAIRLGYGAEITVIDMAPTRTGVKGAQVGGKLLDMLTDVREIRYLAPPRVETPRLSAQSVDELHYLIGVNEKRIRPLLEKYAHNPTSILFVNDISLYLQSGNDQAVFCALRRTHTFIANGYSGQTIKSKVETQISKIEKKLMNKLAKSVDIVIEL